MDRRELDRELRAHGPELREQVKELVRGAALPAPIKRIEYSRWLQRNGLALDWAELDTVAKLEGK